MLIVVIIVEYSIWNYFEFQKPIASQTLICTHRQIYIQKIPSMR